MRLQNWFIYILYGQKLWILNYYRDAIENFFQRYWLSNSKNSVNSRINSRINSLKLQQGTRKTYFCTFNHTLLTTNNWSRKNNASKALNQSSSCFDFWVSRKVSRINFSRQSTEMIVVKQDQYCFIQLWINESVELATNSFDIRSAYVDWQMHRVYAVVIRIGWFEKLPIRWR